MRRLFIASALVILVPLWACSSDPPSERDSVYQQSHGSCSPISDAGRDVYIQCIMREAGEDKLSRAIARACERWIKGKGESETTGADDEVKVFIRSILPSFYDDEERYNFYMATTICQCSNEELQSHLYEHEKDVLASAILKTLEEKDEADWLARFRENLEFARTEHRYYDSFDADMVMEDMFGECFPMAIDNGFDLAFEDSKESVLLEGRGYVDSMRGLDHSARTVTMTIKLEDGRLITVKQPSITSDYVVEAKYFARSSEVLVFYSKDTKRRFAVPPSIGAYLYDKFAAEEELPPAKEELRGLVEPMKVDPYTLKIPQ